MSSETPDIRLGQHISSEHFEAVEPDALGTKDNPFVNAPEDWHENGLPYGAWCRCGECGDLGRATIAFDFYADGPGDKLQCERCMMRQMFANK